MCFYLLIGFIVHQSNGPVLDFSFVCFMNSLEGTKKTEIDVSVATDPTIMMTN